MLGGWISQEFINRGGESINWKEWNELVPSVDYRFQAQTNGVDCGVYALLLAEQFCTRAVTFVIQAQMANERLQLKQLIMKHCGQKQVNPISENVMQEDFGSDSDIEGLNSVQVHAMNLLDLRHIEIEKQQKVESE